MGNEGSLHVVWSNKGEAREPEFTVRFVPHNAVGDVTDHSSRFQGEESLWSLLALSLALESEHVEAALRDLHEKGSAEIDSLNISDRDLRRFKLL